MKIADILKRRLAFRKTTREPFDDGYHVALVIQGGGMRAVFAAGMAEELQNLGLDNCFDSFHGSSAGALIAAYTIANQASVSADIFCEEAASKRFINPLRVFTGKRIMDLKWMIYEVFARIRLLNTDRVLERSKNLFVIATSATTGNSVSLSNFKTSTELLGALEASAFLPIIAGHAAKYAGDDLVDGGLSQGVAIESAISSGATHIVLLLTQRWLDQKPASDNFKGDFEAMMLKWFYGAALSKLYRNRKKFAQQVFDSMSPDGLCVFRNVQIQAVFPPVGTASLSRLTTSNSLMQAARQAGQAAVKKALLPT
jgi:predicted patatin/cPLA2 family phospholipase